MIFRTSKHDLHLLECGWEVEAFLSAWYFSTFFMETDRELSSFLQELQAPAAGCALSLLEFNFVESHGNLWYVGQICGLNIKW